MWVLQCYIRMGTKTNRHAFNYIVYITFKIFHHMNIENIEKETLKKVITEFLFENPAYFKKIIEEILLENNFNTPEEKTHKRKILEKMIDEDFEKYDEVFKSLA